MLTIKDVSKRTGLAASAIRYYEDKGLILPGRREESNYRIYTEEDIHRLEQIQYFTNLRFSLEEIRTLLDATPKEVRKRVEEQLQKLHKESYMLADLVQYGRDFVTYGISFLGGSLSEILGSPLNHGMLHLFRHLVTECVEFQQDFLTMKILDEVYTLLAGFSGKEEDTVSFVRSLEEALKGLPVSAKFLTFILSAYCARAEMVSIPGMPKPELMMSKEHREAVADAVTDTYLEEFTESIRPIPDRLIEEYIEQETVDCRPLYEAVRSAWNREFPFYSFEKTKESFELLAEDIPEFLEEVLAEEEAGSESDSETRKLFIAIADAFIQCYPK